METSHQIRQYIESLREDPDSLTPSNEILIAWLERHLPPIPQNGKVCPMCERKCFCACRMCPHCEYRFKPPKTRIETMRMAPEPMNMLADDCIECLHRIEPSQLKVLSCNCAYHIECLKKIAQKPRKRERVCFGCDKRTPITENVYE